MIWLEYNTDGLIVNAVEYDNDGTYQPPNGNKLVLREDTEAWVGWTYDENSETFTAPEPEVEPDAA